MRTLLGTGASGLAVALSVALAGTCRRGAAIAACRALRYNQAMGTNNRQW